MGQDTSSCHNDYIALLQGLPAAEDSPLRKQHEEICTYKSRNGKNSLDLHLCKINFVSLRCHYKSIEL